MNVEQQPGNAAADRAARVARHAALADPVRLRIVDLLRSTDLSPTELRLEVGISSNLLAHHLDVLDRAGLVDRRRSEGDARRGYVTLSPGERRLQACETGLSDAAWRPGDPLLFVCTGNTARSPFAAARWNLVAGGGGGVAGSPSAPRARSGGTRPGTRVPDAAIEEASRFGVDLSGHSPGGYDDPGRRARTVVLCDRAYEWLGSGRGGADGERSGERGDSPGARDDRLWHWAVPNPGAVGTAEAYGRAFAEIAERIDDLVASA